MLWHAIMDYFKKLFKVFLVKAEKSKGDYITVGFYLSVGKQKAFRLCS